MDFELPDSSRMVRDTVARFVQEELVPHEALIIRREAERGFADTALIPPELEATLQEKARSIGLWGIDVPEEFGGQDLGMLTKCLVIEQLKNSIVPFVLPPESPNLFMLKELCKGDQVDRYLLPYSRGEKKSCLALSEPGAGSDAAAIKTRAERKNGKWVLNGTKLWISGARRADFMIVMAVTDAAADKRAKFTAFLVDKGTPGMSIPTSFPMIGEYHPYEVVFDNVELDDSQVLGEVGAGFAPLSKRLGVRRLEIASRCLGLATRCLNMMIEQANTRQTFGAPLADRQAVQWWISDSYQEIEMVRLMVYQMAWKMDAGKDVRLDGSMVKVQGTEMITRVVDRAMQLFGGMGVSKELPLEYISRMCRVMRIVEGPSEVHRWVVARELLRGGIPEA
ncbi:acyl-CoA dehydrogenase family protein [Achromobacter agilis]|uniref:Medium-chain specific acyl-CoA dehydrogenase, mitochondrial n=1 Tax=Achromobacter agilis TaxID=1353888 RepID=A0A446CM73_9BURK|nr:acyl-CoA dehydrogenase family protein [Achromobacter agilis]SSW69002.1 (R)-benzylsuccinyl-CoA dehydrogenase [Achromobacter agilis]